MKFEAFQFNAVIIARGNAWKNHKCVHTQNYFGAFYFYSSSGAEPAQRRFD